MALEDGARYCYSPAAASDSPLPNSPNSFSRNSSAASSPTTICKINALTQTIYHYFTPLLFLFSRLSPGDVNHKHEVITEDEEIDISVDDDDPYEKSFNAKAESMGINKFSFSISNILSDHFGPKPVKLEQNPADKNLFRPFEIKNFIDSGKPFVQNPSSIFLSNFRLSEIFDYSTKHASQIKSDNSLRSSLYNSLASYPKIHEEILNSHKKSPGNFHSSTSKIPPLGGLCQTISQIGQEKVAPSTQLKTSLAHQQSTSPDLIKIQHSSNDSVDSDDCASEASTIKDESQKMFPAWVSTQLSYSLEIDLLCLSFSPQIFCTRYSDRPSSGMLSEFIFIRNNSTNNIITSLRKVDL